MMDTDWVDSDLCSSRSEGGGEADLPAMWSIARSMEPVTEGSVNGTKRDYHKTLKC